MTKSKSPDQKKAPPPKGLKEKGEKKPKTTKQPKSRSPPATSKTSSPSEKPPAAKKRRRSTGSKKGTAASSAVAAEKTRPDAPSPTSTLIIDNGGDTLKYGWIQEAAPRQLPNVTARLKHQWTVLVGDELQKVQNPNQMHSVTRSTERGIITNLGNQVQVWKRLLDILGIAVPQNSEASQAFSWKVGGARATKVANTTAEQKPENKIPASLCAVLILLPPHCPRIILDQVMYVWLEDFGVSHVGFATSPVCATTPHADFECGCVVDMGWSATHIVPFFRGRVINSPKVTPASTPAPVPGSSSKTHEDDDHPGQTEPTAPAPAPAPAVVNNPTALSRLPLGGRHLVNIWKYYTSYRQWNLMDQEWILRDVFQQLAFVSLEFGKDMALARRLAQGRRPYDRNFVLPNYQKTFQGHVEIPESLKRQQEADQEAEEEEDEDFDDNRDDEDDDDDSDDDDMEVEVVAEDNLNLDEVDNNDDEAKSKEKDKEGAEKEKKKPSRKAKKESEEADDDDDDDSDDEEGLSKEALRERIIRQKREEERRRREQEEEEQVLNVSVERFTIPEVLFHPSDAGLPIEMAGLHQAIAQSIKACPRHFQPALYRSIQLTGGLSQLPNLQERLQRELRALVPGQFEVQVSRAEAPIQQAWLGARDWVRKTPYAQWSVSRDEWEASQKRKAWMRLLSSQGGVLV
jgi:actin-related protein